MARKLFVLSVLTFTLVGCMGPEKGPSPVTDGGLTAFGAPAFDPLAPLKPVPAKAGSKATTKKKTGDRLPINNSSSK
ncbi:MAG: hypothetical protein WCL22_00710 [bacterium]